MTRGHCSLADLERDLEGLDAPADVPEAGLITIFSTVHNGGTIDAVDADRGLYRIDGELMQVRNSAWDVLESSGSSGRGST